MADYISESALNTGMAGSNYRQIATGDHCFDIGSPQSHLWLRTNPSVLVHDKPDVLPILFVGIYSSDGKHELEDVIIVQDDSDFINANHTWARLSSISMVQVFRMPSNGSCQGILIYYKKEAPRTLGQCKVGIDHMTEYKMPTCLCFAMVPDEQLQIECATLDTDHRHGSLDWTCCQMTGTLEWSVIGGASILRYKAE